MTEGDRGGWHGRRTTTTGGEARGDVRGQGHSSTDRQRKERHFAQALADLADFRKRLRGVFTAVRTRLVWVEGQVYARLRDWRRAHDRLGKAQKTWRRRLPPGYIGRSSCRCRGSWSRSCKAESASHAAASRR